MRNITKLLIMPILIVIMILAVIHLDAANAVTIKTKILQPRVVGPINDWASSGDKVTFLSDNLDTTYLTSSTNNQGEDLFFQPHGLEHRLPSWQ